MQSSDSYSELQDPIKDCQYPKLREFSRALCPSCPRDSDAALVTTCFDLVDASFQVQSLESISLQPMCVADVL